MLSKIEIKKLYESNNVKKYNKILSNYDKTIEKVSIKNKTNPLLFIELDKFYRFELPKNIKNKNYLTLKELSKIMQYKLLRGTFRPRLQKIVDNNDPKLVKIITKKSIKLLYEGLWLEGLKIMIDNLDGIGIATASYIGALVRPDLCSIMSDEIISLFSDGKKLYTIPNYVKIQKALSNKITILNQKNNKHNWTLVDIENIFWIISN